MTDELVDVFDENYESCGTMLKSEVRRRGLWCQAIHCWIIRPRPPGFVLYQKRGPDKTIYANALDISAAGHYRAGEDIPDGVREISEELGLKVNFNDLISLGIKIDVATVKSNIVREFCHVFLLIKDMKPQDYLLAKDELRGLVEISVPDGLALFSRETDSVFAEGVELAANNKLWTPVRLRVKREDFIPRIDPYYFKVFILADRVLRGEKYLAI